LLVWLVIIALVAGAVQLTRSLQIPVRAGLPVSTGEPVSGRARVIDGDSLDIGGERIRLFGIDAPEGRQDCTDAAGRGYACGREAARALATQIGGRNVTCTPVDHDRYAREVAVCSVDGRDLGEAMVRNGHAIELPAHSRGRYAAAEREARERKRGLWAGQFERPSDWRREHPR
jgi:endonuclease YncB( thermonuclease family)